MRAPLIATGLLVIACIAAVPTAAPANDPDFGSYWHDGKAELDGYRLSVLRYGQPRTAQAVLIYVTEPFSTSKHVKVDDPSKNPADTFDALKLNFVRSFQTGIYDYHTMVSLFTRSRDFSPVKITFTSAEWCGQVYEHLDFVGSRVSERFDSYFENESAARTLEVPRDGIAEDNLFILLRGLRGAYLEPGARRTVHILASPFFGRLMHQPPAWSAASIERLARPETVRVPAGLFVSDVYVVRIAGQREGRFHIERAYPHRVIRWSWKAEGAGSPVSKLGGTDTGELTGSARLEYWKLHDPGDESYLKQLGLETAVR